MNFMKLGLSGLLALTMALPTYAQGKFTLSGNIKGLPDSVRIVLSDIEDPNGDVKKLATVNPSNGKFEMTGDLKSPAMCKLYFQRHLPGDDEYKSIMSVRMMIDPSQLTLNPTLDFDSLINMRYPEMVMTVKGSKTADEYAEFMKAVNAAERKFDNASYLSASKYFETNDNPDSVKKYEALKGIAEKEFLDAKLAFIATHPDYNISAYETQRELENIFKFNASEIDKMADMVMACPDTVRTNMVEKRRKFAHRYALGMECPKFDATTPEGEAVNFNSLLKPGKYSFIDFWASWCGPCREAIPHVKELYKKYGDRLDVFSVSVDENEAAWRKAMEKEQMEWRQFHLNGKEQMNKGAQAFFITSIPRLVLLDDNGTVICSTHDPDVVTEILEARLGK